MTKVLSILVLPVLLAACDPITIASLAASGLSYAFTGKSVSDHTVSAMAGRDCAMLRIIEGAPVCRVPETPGGTPAPVAVAAAELDAAAARPMAAHGSDALPQTAPAAGPAGGRLLGGALPPASSNAEPGRDGVRDAGRTVAVSVERLAGGNARLVGCGPKAEVFALVQDDGTLEVFVHDPARAGPSNLQMVLRIVDYAHNPDALTGLWINGSFYFVNTIIV
ncbi:MAG: hypothetical protein V3U18_09400 [Alphaproteobacteria bacterium]